MAVKGKGFWKSVRPMLRVVEEATKPPALINELTHIVSPQPYGVFVDATFGTGVHTKFLKKRFPGLGVIGIDADGCGYDRTVGLYHRYNNPPSFSWMQCTWSNLGLGVAEASKTFYDPVDKVDLVFFDFGLNNEQLFLPERGFLARQNGPLDMRLCNKIDTLPASTVVNTFDEESLFKIFSLYGGETSDISRRFAQAILQQREKRSFNTTESLAKFLCEDVLREHHEQACLLGPHPAEKCFLGLWTYCSDYYVELAKGLREAEKILQEDGVLIVSCFHPLESCILQEFEATRTVGRDASFSKVFDEPLRSKEEFIRRNFRNRSGLMFAYRRTGGKQVEDFDELTTQYLLSYSHHPAYDVIKTSSMPGRY